VDRGRCVWEARLARILRANHDLLFSFFFSFAFFCFPFSFAFFCFPFSFLSFLSFFFFLLRFLLSFFPFFSSSYFTLTELPDFSEVPDLGLYELLRKVTDCVPSLQISFITGQHGEKKSFRSTFMSSGLNFLFFPFFSSNIWASWRRASGALQSKSVSLEL